MDFQRVLPRLLDVMKTLTDECPQRLNGNTEVLLGELPAEDEHASVDLVHRNLPTSALAEQ